MSHNQSRTERSDSAQYRKTGRTGSSNLQRQFSSGSSSAKGGGGASSAPSNRGSSTKYNNNAQGGQLRPKSPNVSSDSGNSSAARVIQNGVHPQQLNHRVSDAPVANTSSSVKQTDTPSQKITRAVPRPPLSNVSSAAQPSDVSTTNNESKAPMTPAKAPGDASKSFPLQFGSISPGVMNGTQIPARTSSAPPNLDEQKRDQARQQSLRAAPGIPNPSAHGQHNQKKDAGNLDQPNAGVAQPFSKSKRDTQVSAASPLTHLQRPSVHPIPSMHMQLPFHQLQVPAPFGGPNPLIHSQAMSGTSIQMPIPIPLPIGNPSMQQQMFVSGLQSHPMQPQGMMHQGHNLNFSTQMGAPLPTQLGYVGMNMAPQFPQQQARKYSSSCKTVKITHPETHEELTLDGSPGLRSRPNVPPQSQPIPSFPPGQPVNYYSNYFHPESSAPPNSTQAPNSQLPRFSNQVTIKPAVGSHSDKEKMPPTVSSSVGKSETLRPARLHGEDAVHSRKESEPKSLTSLPHSKPDSESSTSAALASPGNVENDVRNTSDFASVSKDSASLIISSSNEPRNGVVEPDTTKDEHKKPGNREEQDQVNNHMASLSSLPSHSPELETVEAKPTSSRASVVQQAAKEPLSTIIAPVSDISTLTSEADAGRKTVDASESLGDRDNNSIQVNPVTVERKEHGEAVLSESSEFLHFSAEIEGSPDHDGTASTSSDLLEPTQQNLEVPSGHVSDVKIADRNNEHSASAASLSVQDDITLKSELTSSVHESFGAEETTAADSSVVDQDSAAVSVPSPHEGPLKLENEEIDSSNGGLVSSSSLTSKDKVLSDTNVAKNAVPRGKKKKKELYRRAEAAGTSSDLYMAYKGPEEKKEAVSSLESAENTSTIDIKQTSSDVSQEYVVPNEKPGQSKVEPDDWEDAAEISTPQLETSKNDDQGFDGDANELMTKRYSRDFLLKFAEQCPDLPEGFEITSDIGALIVSSVDFSRESYPSPGRNIDRQGGSSRPDRRGMVLGDEDKWSKFPGPLMSGRGDMRSDVGYGGNIVGFRPGQGGNYGVLRNPRAQIPLQYVGGILAGPMQSFGPQGGLQRNNSDSDRWQRGSGFQKGLMPYPLSPQQTMHKAEKKYEIGKVTDEEQAKQRQLKGILNKLTPQNFEKLFQQVKQVNIDNVVTLSGVISQIFDKALMEPTFCEMYANFCAHLAADLPELSVDNERITFKRLLLNKCQEEFERGEREEEELNKVEEGENKQTVQEREEKRLQARRRMLGNIRLIGELYKKKMLTERIMHECINKLLGHYESPDEENIEALCKLMSTIGEMIDHLKAKEHIDAYFDIMAQLSNNMKLSSRLRFMLKDAIDLRKNKWQQRRKVDGPKKIEEVHRDAAQERHAQASRVARPTSFGSSARRPSPMDFGPRAPSMIPSPSSQMGAFRAMSPQMRGYGHQDTRMDERHSFDSRTTSFPLPQRPLGDDSITLGPQGGLARGMAFRGQPSAHNIPMGEMTSPGDAQRMRPGLNGLNYMPERTAYGQREPRYGSERYVVPSTRDQSHLEERGITYGHREPRNADSSFDSSFATSPPARGGPLASMQNVSSEKVWPEEQLRDKSMTTIKEFYSARDENEVALCIKDLNAPSFHSSMISIWVTDSFERKDMERDLLTQLLINLTKSRDGMISEDQLIQGFESVLAVLEDAVNDAPRAAEFLGRLFAKVILENVVSLSEIGQLIYEGGEEQGQLVETGLAAEVLEHVFNIIKSEKGDSVLNEIRSRSNLRLDNFRPPGSINKPWRLDKFI